MPNGLLRSDAAAWGLAFLAFLLNQAVNAGVGLYVAAHLDPSQFGSVNIARTFLFLAATIMPLGLDLALQRTLAAPGLDEPRRRRTVGMLRSIPFTLSLCLAVLAAAGGADLVESHVFTEPGFSAALAVALIALPFWVDLAVLGAAFRGVLNPLPSLLAQSIVQPVVRLAATLTLVHFGYAFWALPAGLAIGYAAGWAVLMPGASRVFGAMRLPRVAALPELRAVLRYSLPLALALIGATAMKIVDLLILGYFQPAAEAGRYSVAVLIAQLVALVGAASGQTLGPRVAEAHSRQDLARIAGLQRSNMKLIAVAAAPLLACIVFWGGRITLLIGDAYRVEAAVLTLLAMAAAITAVTGNLGHSLGMTGHQKTEASAVWLGLAVQILGGLVLVPTAGQLGAAVACLAGAVTLWLLRVLLISRRLNIVFLGLTPVYPFVAALVIGLAVWQADLWIGARSIASTAVVCLTVVAGYGALMWMFRNRFQLEASLRSITG